MAKVTIFTDGAARGNPGAAGIGVVVSDEQGKVLAEISEYIGETTNNVAEYKALIRGLEEAVSLGADDVEINTDSELMARQITGVYKVKAEHLKELHSRVMTLLGSFRRVSISHVVREYNRLADKLASSAAQKKPVDFEADIKKNATENKPKGPTEDKEQPQLDL